MWRWFMLLTLAGCVDFVGELGRIGFSTDLVMGDGDAWSPDSPVVAGTEFRVAPVFLVGEESERLLDVGPTVSGSLTLAPHPDGGWRISGSRGRVEWDGEAHDRFRVRFAEPASVDVSPAGLEAGDFAIPVGSDCGPRVTLRDASDAALGFRPDTLELVIDGVFRVTEGEIHASAPGSANLYVEVGEHRLPGPQVLAVDLSQVAWEVEQEPFDSGHDWVRLVATADGLQVGCVAVGATVGGSTYTITPDGMPVPKGAEPVFDETLHAE